MTLRTLGLLVGLGLAGILSEGSALGQKVGALRLDARPGADPLLIDVTEITGQYPRPAVREYEKGVADARKGKHAAAAKHLEEAIRRVPEFFSAHNALGVLHQRMEQYRDAEREYTEAHRLNPRSAAPLVNLGSLYIEEALSGGAGDSLSSRRKLNDALASLNAAFAIQPSSASGHYLTGVVYYLTGFDEDAESHLQRALDNSSGMGVARLALARVYIRMQAWQSVVVQLDAYLAENRFAANRHWVHAAREVAAQQIKSFRQ